MYSCRMQTSDFPLGLMTNSVENRNMESFIRGGVCVAGGHANPGHGHGGVADASRSALTFLGGGVLDRQRDQLLVGGQDGPLRLRLLPLHVSVELPPLGPRAELLHGDLLKVEALLQVGAELFQLCGKHVLA